MGDHPGGPPTLNSSYPASPMRNSFPPNNPGGFEQPAFQPNFAPSGMTPYPQQPHQNQMPHGMTPYPQQPPQSAMPSGMTPYPQRPRSGSLSSGTAPFPQHQHQPSGMMQFGTNPYPGNIPNPSQQTHPGMQCSMQSQFANQPQYFPNQGPTSPQAPNSNPSDGSYFQQMNASTAPVGSAQTQPYQSEMVPRRMSQPNINIANLHELAVPRGDDFLESGEASLSSSEEMPKPAYGTCSLQGMRSSNEDRVFCFPRFDSRIPNVSCFGVFDGHGGPQAADHCVEFMPNFLKTAIFSQGYSFNQSHAEKVLIECFGEADREYIKRAAALGFAQNDMSGLMKNIQEKNLGSAGCTACVVFMVGKYLFCANTGDSKAILYNSAHETYVDLSNAHKPSDPSEMNRIQAAGGQVTWDGDCARVNNILATSRGIGDIYLKSLIIPDPEIIVREITNGDDFVIIATDGLWDVFNPMEACFLTLQAGDARAAAKSLAEAATQKGSTDNISVTIVDTRPLYMFRQAPPQIKIDRNSVPEASHEDSAHLQRPTTSVDANQQIESLAEANLDQSRSKTKAGKSPRSLKSEKGSCSCM